MVALAKDGVHLDALIRLLVPILKAFDHAATSRRGAPQDFGDWQIAALAVVAILARRKTKTAQYRFLTQRADRLLPRLGLVRWPSRATYF